MKVWLASVGWNSASPPQIPPHFFPFFVCGEFLGTSQGNQDIHFQPKCTSAKTKGCSYTLKIIPCSLVTKARTMKHPGNEGSVIQSVLTRVMFVLLLSLVVEQEGSHHACQDLGKLGGNDLRHHLWKLHFHRIGLDEGAQTEQIDLLHYLSHKRHLTFGFVSGTAVAVGLKHDSSMWRSLHHAWRPSTLWGGRIAVSWPLSLSLSCGWLWSAPGCNFVSFPQMLPDFWVPREALRTQDTFNRTLSYTFLFLSKYHC